MPGKHLDAHTVASIRRRHIEGDKITHLAEHYGSSESTVRRIVQGKTYTNVLDSAADRDKLNIKDTPRVASSQPRGWDAIRANARALSETAAQV